MLTARGCAAHAPASLAAALLLRRLLFAGQQPPPQPRRSRSCAACCRAVPTLLPRRSLPATHRVACIDARWRPRQLLPRAVFDPRSHVWSERIASAANVSDWPTRVDKIQLSPNRRSLSRSYIPPIGRFHAIYAQLRQLASVHDCVAVRPPLVAPPLSVVGSHGHGFGLRFSHPEELTLLSLWCSERECLFYHRGCAISRRAPRRLGGTGYGPKYRSADAAAHARP